MSLPTGVEQEWLGGSLLSIHALAQRVVWEWMRDPAADPEMARTVWMTSFIWHVSLSSCECPIKRPWKATTPWEKSGKHPTAASNVFLRQAVELQLINCPTWIVEGGRRDTDLDSDTWSKNYKLQRGLFKKRASISNGWLIEVGGSSIPRKPQWRGLALRTYALKRFSKLVHVMRNLHRNFHQVPKSAKQTSSSEVFSAKSETWTRRLWNSMASHRPKDQSLCRRKGDRQIESLLAGCKEVRDTDGD